MEKILIIEDEPEVIENLVEILEIYDYDVVSTLHGREAIKIAENQKPDLILCDVMMPEMDGYEVLREIKRNPATFRIPFLFLTAKAEKSDLRYGMELGADDYITKPFEINEIINAVKTRLAKQKTIDRHFETKFNDLRKNIASTIPHELRTPLNSILGFTQILLSNFKELPENDIKIMLTNIHESGERLYRLIVNYSFYTSLLSLENANQTKKFEVVRNSEMLVTDQSKQLASRYKYDNKIKFSLVDYPLNVEQKHFLKLIEELLDNAIKFSEDDSVIYISSEVIDDKYYISFENAGRGFTQNEINEIGAFVQFGRDKFEQQGSGMGLAIAKRICEIYGGSLKIHSQPGATTTVTATLPILK